MGLAEALEGVGQTVARACRRHLRLRDHHFLGPGGRPVAPPDRPHLRESDDADEHIVMKHRQGRGHCPVDDPGRERVEGQLRGDRGELLFHRLADTHPLDQLVEDEPAVDGSSGRHQEPADEPDHDPVDRFAGQDDRQTEDDRDAPRVLPHDARGPGSGPLIARPRPGGRPDQASAVERERRHDADPGKEEIEDPDDDQHVRERAGP